MTAPPANPVVNRTGTRPCDPVPHLAFREPPNARSTMPVLRPLDMIRCAVW